MVLVSKVKKVARKVNAVALAGAVVVGGMGLMSFTKEKEAVIVPMVKTAGLATVTHGVLRRDDANGRLYITPGTVPNNTLNCALSAMFACKITFDDSLIQYDDDGDPYVSTSASYTTTGVGPYNP